MASEVRRQIKEGFQQKPFYFFMWQRISTRRLQPGRAGIWDDGEEALFRQQRTGGHCKRRRRRRMRRRRRRTNNVYK